VPTPLAAWPRWCPRTYSEASLLLIALLRTLWRLSYQDMHARLTAWPVLAHACGLSEAAPVRPLTGLLGAYGGHTPVLPLLPGSRAIDTGGTTCPAGVMTDQRGRPRLVNGACDIGAFESGGFTLGVAGGNNQSALINAAFGQPLTVTVTAKAASEPVTGGVVAFTVVPNPNGATATLVGNPATINAGGQAGVTATANGKTGMYQVTAGAAGANPAATSFALTNTVQAIVVGPVSLGAATVGTAYIANLTASGGTGAGYVFALAPNNTLPAGLMLNMATGAITGTPTTAGAASFTVTVTDNGGNSGNQLFTLTINPGTLTVTAPTGSGSGNSGTSTMPTLLLGTTLPPTAQATGGVPTGSVTFTSSNPGVVTIDPNTGVMKGITGGQATIIAVAANGVRGTITVTVTPATGSGLVPPPPAPMTHANGPESSATPMPQPNRAPDGRGTGPPQPQAAGSGTAIPIATPAPQPARH